MAAGNSINEATTGVCGFTGTAFTATPVTQYNTLLGGATSSTIAQAAPSATAGIPLVSNGASANPSFTTAVVAGGGTGVTTMTTAYAPVCAGTTATGALQVASTGLSTSGYVLTSNGSSALPSFQAATGGFPWTDVTGTSQAMSINNGYVADNASLVTLTLPTTAAIGDTVIVVGKGAGGWKITYTTSQQIQVGSSASTVTTGNIASINQWDSVTLTCVTANNIWAARAVQGNITVA